MESKLGYVLICNIPNEHMKRLQKENKPLIYFCSEGTFKSIISELRLSMLSLHGNQMKRTIVTSTNIQNDPKEIMVDIVGKVIEDVGNLSINTCTNTIATILYDKLSNSLIYEYSKGMESLYPTLMAVVMDMLNYRPSKYTLEYMHTLLARFVSLNHGIEAGGSGYFLPQLSIHGFAKLRPKLEAVENKTKVKVLFNVLPLTSIMQNKAVVKRYSLVDAHNSLRTIATSNRITSSLGVVDPSLLSDVRYKLDFYNSILPDEYKVNYSLDSILGGEFYTKADGYEQLNVLAI